MHIRNSSAFFLRLTAFFLPMAGTAPSRAGAADDLVTQPADGYRGIWYMNQPLKDEYRFKYSGGFATYPQQHTPIAIYVASR
jgi:hypothetical protein